MDSQADRATTEGGSLSFEDLPDQVIGIILRKKLERFQDKVRLTQASPSARRLTRGPNCEPGVMGETLRLNLTNDSGVKNKAVHIGIAYDDTCTMSFCPSHPDFPLALDYLAARSKAFSKVSIDGGSGDLETQLRLLDALYRQGACCPVTLTFTGSGKSSSFRKYLDAAQALVSHWLTVSEGIHSPRDRSLEIGSPQPNADDARLYLAFLGRLKGIGGLEFSEPDDPSVPFPQFPHLTDCLERLSISSPCKRTAPGLFSDFAALRSIVFSALTSGERHDPRPYLRKLFESSASSLESVTLCFSTGDDEPPFTMDLFEGLPKLKSLTLRREMSDTIRFPPSSDPYFQTDIVLPSLEELNIHNSYNVFTPPSIPPISPLVNLVLPRLQKLEIHAVFDVQRPLDVGCIARFPSLTDVHIHFLGRNPGPTVPVSLGDLSGLTRLRELRVWGTGAYDALILRILLRVQEGSSVLPPQMRGVAANEELLASSEGVRRNELVFKRAYTLHDE